MDNQKSPTHSQPENRPREMEANIFPSLKPSFLIKNQSSQRNHTFLFVHQRLLRPLHATGPAANSGTNADETKGDTISSSPDKPRPPVNTLNIRYRSRSRKRSMEQQQQSAKAPAPPKEWESMTLAEKAMELYVGEKGLLFWLNKFAYASIFIIIGGWILFRFVGPSLGLYQLDAPPLSPTDVLKGSG